MKYIPIILILALCSCSIFDSPKPTPSAFENLVNNMEGRYTIKSYNLDGVDIMDSIKYYDLLGSFGFSSYVKINTGDAQANNESGLAMSYSYEIILGDSTKEVVGNYKYTIDSLKYINIKTVDFGAFIYVDRKNPLKSFTYNYDFPFFEPVKWQFQYDTNHLKMQTLFNGKRHELEMVKLK